MTTLEAYLTGVGTLLLLASLFFLPPGALFVGGAGGCLLAVGLGSTIYSLRRELKQLYGNVREEGDER